MARSRAAAKQRPLKQAAKLPTGDSKIFSGKLLTTTSNKNINFCV
jgi:hypothetical protein